MILLAPRISASAALRKLPYQTRLQGKGRVQLPAWAVPANQWRKLAMSHVQAIDAWNVEGSAPVLSYSIETPGAPISGLSYSGDGTLLATAGVFRWNASERRSQPLRGGNCLAHDRSRCG